MSVSVYRVSVFATTGSVSAFIIPVAVYIVSVLASCLFLLTSCLFISHAVSVTAYTVSSVLTRQLFTTYMFVLYSDFNLFFYYLQRVRLAAHGRVCISLLF